MRRDSVMVTCPGPQRAGAHRAGSRRLVELSRQGVHVPSVLRRERSGTLVLGDLGPSLAACQRAQPHEAARDALAANAVRAMHQAHARGAYFGQSLPRNMTWDGERIGFLDFEEDPLEVMSLKLAQARDWVIFAYGMARDYRQRPEALSAILRPVLRSQPHPVVAQARKVGTRLHPLARISAHVGSSAAMFACAVQVLLASTGLF